MPVFALKLHGRDRPLVVKVAGDSRKFSNRVTTMLAFAITSAELLSTQSSHFTFPIAIYRGDESLVFKKRREKRTRKRTRRVGE